jgi:flagellar assembly protein FliH
MAEQRIIARAAAAGTRRLTVIPLDPLVERAGDDGHVAVATAAPPATGLNAFLAAAQQQGAALVEVAREQADQIAAQAAQEGYEVGYREGQAKAQREIADLLAFAEAAVREVSDTRARILEENETALVELAIQAAEKILQTTLDAQPERVADVLRGALRKAYVRDRLQVVCNPEDLALVEQSEEALQAQVGTLKNLELVGDRRVQRGGVIVRTPGGDVDATIGSQLDRLRAAMLGEDARDG